MSISGRFHGWLTTHCHEKYHVCLLSVTSFIFDPKKSFHFVRTCRFYLHLISAGTVHFSCDKTEMESRRKVLKRLG